MTKSPITHYFLAADLGLERDPSAFATLALRREDFGGFDHAQIV